MAFLFANTTNAPVQKPILAQPQEEYMVRPTPQQAIEIIKRYEGLRTKAYQDSNGIWTIGYGNTHEVHPGDEISEEQAEEELREYLQAIGPLIIRATKMPLNNNQYSALLSFAYNVGIGNLDKSTLLKYINGKDNDRVAQEFVKWDKDHRGVELAGLRARRLAEASLYFTPTNEIKQA